MRIVESSLNQAPCARRAFVLLLPLVLSPSPARAAGFVGNGTPGSCTETTLNAALAGGGAVTFSFGGAVYVQGGVSTIDASTFPRNRGGNGGAIGYLGGDGTGPANGPTVRDSVFVGNATQARVSIFGVTGGALYLDGAGDGEVRIERCTFRDDAAWAGGGITVAAPASNVTIRASIVAPSTAANGGNPWNTGKCCDVGSPQRRTAAT